MLFPYCGDCYRTRSFLSFLRHSCSKKLLWRLKVHIVWVELLLYFSRFTAVWLKMGDFSWLKSIRSNTLCSGFYWNPFMGASAVFSHWYLCRNRYKGCGVWKCYKKCHIKKYCGDYLCFQYQQFLDRNGQVCLWVCMINFIILIDNLRTFYSMILSLSLFLFFSFWHFATKIYGYVLPEI